MRLACLTVTLILPLQPGEAFAQTREARVADSAPPAAPVPTRSPLPWAARAELGLGGRSDVASQLWSMSGVVELASSVSRTLGLAAAWGVAVARETPPQAAGQMVLASGNVLLHGRYEDKVSEADALRLTLSLALPAAWLPRDNTRRALVRNAYAISAAARGLWDAWLWAPEQTTLAVAGRLRHVFGPGLVADVEAGVGASVPVGDALRGYQSAYAQLAPLLEWKLAPLYLGFRPQVVYTQRSYSPIPVQLSALAYVKVAHGAWQLQASGICNLGEPLGLGGAGLSMCGVLMAVSALEGP